MCALALQSKLTRVAAYLTVSELALNMIRESTALNDTMAAVSLLDASFTLLQQSSNTEACSSDAAYSTLHDLLHVCLDNDTHSRLQNVKKSLKSVRLKNNLLQLVMRTVNKLLETDAAIMNVSDHRTCTASPLFIYYHDRILGSLIFLTS